MSDFCMGHTMKKRIDALIEQMRQPAPDIRQQAAKELGTMARLEQSQGERLAERRDVIQGLITLLADDHLAVRDAAEEALVMLRGSEVVQALVLCLSSPSTTLLNAAIDILSRIGHDSIDAICALVDSKDHDIRKFGCDILGNLRYADAVYDLIDLLNDPHVNVAIAAGEALGKIGNPDAVPYLIRALHHPDTWMKCIAAEALGKIRDQRAVEPFIEMATYEDPIVIYTIMKAMGNLRDDRVLPYILSILQSNPIFAPSAVQAIQSLATSYGEEIYVQVKAAGVEDVFIRLLQSENLEVLKSSITLAGYLHLTDAVPYLGRLLNHEEMQIVEETLQALIRIGEPGVQEIQKAMPSIHTRLTQTTDAELRETLQQILSKKS